MNLIGVSSEVKHRKSMSFLIAIFTILYLLLTFVTPMKHIHETVLESHYQHRFNGHLAGTKRAGKNQ
jgi:hypothetical protein